MRGEGVNGVVGSGSVFGVFALGNLGANGAKSFLNPHPSDPAQAIRFVCLEGNESGTYFRGSTRLDGNTQKEIFDINAIVTDGEGP